MKITRDIVLDLLPLYLAGEASADTRALVEEYVQTDPELRACARGPEPVLPNCPWHPNQTPR
jgi:anti-sigma factor RsiW